VKGLNFLERIPDYLYLFPEHSEKGTVFFSAAYDAKLALCQAQWGIEGAQLYCIKLILWRALSHFLGAVGAVILIHKFRRRAGARGALALSAIFTAYIVFQEFIAQPRELNQIFFKSVFDSTTWLFPLMSYWSIVLYRKLTSPRRQAKT